MYDMCYWRISLEGTLTLTDGLELDVKMSVRGSVTDKLSLPAQASDDHLHHSNFYTNLSPATLTSICVSV